MVLVLLLPIYPTRKLISVHAGMLGSFGHLKVIAHYSLWCYVGIYIIQSKLLMVIHLVLNLMMVKVVLVPGIPCLSPHIVAPYLSGEGQVSVDSGSQNR